MESSTFTHGCDDDDCWYRSNPDRCPMPLTVEHFGKNYDREDPDNPYEPSVYALCRMCAPSGRPRCIVCKRRQWDDPPDIPEVGKVCLMCLSGFKAWDAPEPEEAADFLACYATPACYGRHPPSISSGLVDWLREQIQISRRGLWEERVRERKKRIEEAEAALRTAMFRCDRRECASRGPVTNQTIHKVVVNADLEGYEVYPPQVAEVCSDCYYMLKDPKRCERCRRPMVDPGKTVGDQQLCLLCSEWIRGVTDSRKRPRDGNDEE